eukprot:g16587.t1
MNNSNQPSYPSVDEPNDESPSQSGDSAGSDTSEGPPPLWTDSESVGSSVPSLWYGSAASTVPVTTDEDDDQNLEGFDSDSEGSDGAPDFEDVDLRPGDAPAVRDLNREPDDAETAEDAHVADDSAPSISTHVLSGGNPEHHRLLLALLAYIVEEHYRDGIIIPSRNPWNGDC